MNSFKKSISIILVFILVLALFSGCSDKKKKETDDSATFNFSEGIDENGMWKDIVALDHVELLDYNNIEILQSDILIDDILVQTQIDNILSSYATANEVKDRAVVDGDTLNIDYVGTVDGVEFEGGSTQGAGTEVTVGQTQYVDDFIQQLVGHMPGETFDVNVTFPADYGQENLNGKDAVFKVTINFISESVTPTLDDAFVAENITANYGWKTVDEMKAGIRSDLEKNAIATAIDKAIVTSSAVSEIPESLIEYQKNAMVKYYEDAAASNNMTIEEYLSQMGLSTIEELVLSESEANESAASYSLVIQAIAEDAKISVTKDDLAAFFKDNMGTEDYSSYEKQYGLPYLMQVTLRQKVIDFLQEKITIV